MGYQKVLKRVLPVVKSKIWKHFHGMYQFSAYFRIFALLDNFSNLKISRIVSLWGGGGLPKWLHREVCVCYNRNQSKLFLFLFFSPTHLLQNGQWRCGERLIVFMQLLSRFFCCYTLYNRESRRSALVPQSFIFFNLLGHIPKGLSLYGWIDGAWKSAIKAAKISFETQQFYIATYHIWNWRKMKQLRE